MEVICTINSGGQLPTYHEGLFYTPATEFHVTVGRSYSVAGLGVFQGGLSVLVRDDTDLPTWLPIALFEVGDVSIPAGWEMRFIAADQPNPLTNVNGWGARWGYPELVNSDAHSDALMNREPDALRLFRERTEAGVTDS